jgi:acyl-CoA-binding protein
MRGSPPPSPRAQLEQKMLRCTIKRPLLSRSPAVVPARDSRLVAIAAIAAVAVTQHSTALRMHGEDATAVPYDEQLIRALMRHRRCRRCQIVLSSPQGADMSSQADFEEAQRRVKTLTRAPATSELLELYALYKQASVGDVEGKRPGMLDVKGRAKHDAWAAKKGTSRQTAMDAYVALVDRLLAG